MNLSKLPGLWISELEEAQYSDKSWWAELGALNTALAAGQVSEYAIIYGRSQNPVEIIRLWWQIGKAFVKVRIKGLTGQIHVIGEIENVTKTPIWWIYKSIQEKKKHTTHTWAL